MLEGALIGGVLYPCLVYLISFLMVRLRILKRAPLKKGVKPSILFFLGAALSVIGFGMFPVSVPLCIAFCLAGVALGVINISSL